MALELKYDARFAGAKAIATRNGAQGTTGVRDFGTVYSFGTSDYAICTGYYYDTDETTIYVQTESSIYLIVDLNNPDWMFTEGVAKPSTYTQTQAQYLVNKIIRNNMQIVQNNLVCARFANKFTASQQAQIRELQNRLTARNNALIEQGLCTDITTSYPQGYAELSGYLDALMKGEAVGIATWAIVVIAAAVIAATATAAYFAYKRLADESERDIKYSKELTAILAQKLTPEEYQMLLDETKGIVTKAKIRQALISYGDVIKWAALAFAGYAGYKFIKSRL